MNSNYYCHTSDSVHGANFHSKIFVICNHVLTKNFPEKILISDLLPSCHESVKCNYFKVLLTSPLVALPSLSCSILLLEHHYLHNLACNCSF